LAAPKRDGGGAGVFFVTADTRSGRALEEGRRAFRDTETPWKALAASSMLAIMDRRCGKGVGRCQKSSDDTRERR
jgi:hypothetical protein